MSTIKIKYKPPGASKACVPVAWANFFDDPAIAEDVKADGYTLTDEIMLLSKHTENNFTIDVAYSNYHEPISRSQFDKLLGYGGADACQVFSCTIRAENNQPHMVLICVPCASDQKAVVIDATFSTVCEDDIYAVINAFPIYKVATLTNRQGQAAFVHKNTIQHLFKT